MITATATNGSNQSSKIQPKKSFEITCTAPVSSSLPENNIRENSVHISLSFDRNLSDICLSLPVNSDMSSLHFTCEELVWELIDLDQRVAN